MSKKIDLLLERIIRMEDKLLTLKCEYNMLLCKEDHGGDMGAFAESLNNERKKDRHEIENGDEYRTVVVLVPPNRGASP